MKKVEEVCTSKFVSQAEKFVSLAFAVAEDKIQANKGKHTPGTKALSAAVLSLQNAVSTFIAVAKLND